MKDIPTSVYRLQFNESFTLKKAMEILPYLTELGIEGVYSSPIFVSASGKGYDILDSHHIDPRIGTLSEYEEFCAQLQQYGLKHLLDIVPNHMSIKSPQNQWWVDVLENGPSSEFAGFFAIYWPSEKPELCGKILLPLLKEPFGRALENKEIQLIWHGGFWVVYADYYLPIATATYPLLFAGIAKTLQNEQEGRECLAIIKNEQGFEKTQLVDLYQRSLFLRKQITLLLSDLNGKKGEPRSFDRLDQLLDQQFYRLTHWLLGEQEINYRRFFNHNDLIALRMEKRSVLTAYHKWIFELLQKGQVQGLRIDHIDGLYDPEKYLREIQKRDPSFVVVEKILGPEEKLNALWPICGSVGYDFLNHVNGLFICKKNEKAFDKIYTRFLGRPIEFERLLYERKKRYVFLHMQNEIHFLGELLVELVEKNRYYRDFTRIDLTRAVREILSCFPIYRTYIKPGVEICQSDRESVMHALHMAQSKTPEIDPVIYQYLQDLLLMELPLTEAEKPLALDFLMRIQQLTGPVMAKGLEDSVYYLYNRLISLNEVGGSPKKFGMRDEEFHRLNQQNITQWPYGLLASSTHDTKISEDIRARLNVISERPKEWRDLVLMWKKQNRKYKTLIEGVLYPDYNTEYYIYQLLLGGWSDEEDLKQRLAQTLLKAVREAGVYTSWRLPDEAYEKAVEHFLSSLITPEESNEFYPAFFSFLSKITSYGYWNSLCALVLKIGSCGVVDIYQGQELWDFSLVDPDNRREVDYTLRQKSLKRVRELSFLTLEDRDLKLWVTRKFLQFRRDHKELFLEGEYLPLSTPTEHVIAFMRKYENQVVIVLIGRFLSILHESGWKNLELVLPRGLQQANFRNIFTEKILQTQKVANNKQILPLEEIFSDYPFAVLEPQ